MLAEHDGGGGSSAGEIEGARKIERGGIGSANDAFTQSGDVRLQIADPGGAIGEGSARIAWAEGAENIKNVTGIGERIAEEEIAGGERGFPDVNDIWKELTTGIVGREIEEGLGCRSEGEEGEDETEGHGAWGF